MNVSVNSNECGRKSKALSGGNRDAIQSATMRFIDRARQRFYSSGQTLGRSMFAHAEQISVGNQRGRGQVDPFR